MELISVLSGNKMLLVFYHIFLFHGIMYHVANLRRAHLRVEIHSKVLTYH